MNFSESQFKGYVFATLIGAAGGGLLTIFATKALPKIASQIMLNMMKNMMSQSGAGSCSPEEM